MSVNGTLVEAKWCTLTTEPTHFIFDKCSIYTHDGASAKFSTNSHETDLQCSCIHDQLTVKTQAFSFHLKVKTLIRMETFWKQIRKTDEEEEIRKELLKFVSR